jgi:hypothetical protein
MAEDTRTSWGAKVLLVLALIGAIWVVGGLLGGVLRWAISLFGYIVVAFIAYQLGKIAGRADD